MKVACQIFLESYGKRDLSAVMVKGICMLSRERRLFDVRGKGTCVLSEDNFMSYQWIRDMNVCC